MITVPPGERDTLVVIERPVPVPGGRSAGKETWEPVGDEWVAVRDLLPSRSEQPESGMPVATRRARVRMEWRDDILPTMRLVDGDRIMQIISGPVELGRRAGLEMIVEDYSTTGAAA